MAHRHPTPLHNAQSPDFPGRDFASMPTRNRGVGVGQPRPSGSGVPVRSSSAIPPYRGPARHPRDSYPQSPLDNSDDGIDHSSIPFDVLAYKGEQALALARAARSVIYAEEQLVRKRLAEGEILLSILRDEAEEVQLRLREADCQIVAIRESHQSQGIPVSSEPLDPQLAIVEAELNRPSPDPSEADFHHSPIPDPLEADPQAELAQWRGEELGT